MRNRSTLFTGYPTQRLRAELKASVAEAPITTLFTPGQTFAMLEMRKSELSIAVMAKLMNGTARATIEDKADLAALGYCRLYADGHYGLTPHGHFKSNELARALAEQLGVPIPAFKPEQRRHDGYRRRAFQRGVLSQNGNW
jgi:hypothetical protein